MTNTSALCDRIVALIDACLAEVEASHQPAHISGSFPAAPIPSTLAIAAQR